ncbi:MAG: mechanosensitive ion channel [Proteobacteria bacterium]|nr:mechanosensitive ion channel [Pseudomonadota bacterium]
MAILSAVRATLAGVAAAAAMVASSHAATKADVGELAQAGGWLTSVRNQLAGVLEGASGILAAAPHLLSDLAAAWRAMAADPMSRGGLAELVLIVVALVLCAASAGLVRRATARFRLASTADPIPARGALRLLAFDLADRLAVIATAQVLVQVWFDTGSLADWLAVALLWAAVQWWLAMMAVDVFLRPDQPQLRLLALGEGAVPTVRGVAAALLLLQIGALSVVPVLLGVGLPVPSAQLITFLTGLAMALVAAVGLIRYGRPDAAPPATEAGSEGWWRRLDGLTAACLIGVALLWLAWSAGVLVRNLEVYHTLIWSLGLIAAVIGLDRLLGLSASEPMASVEAAPQAARVLGWIALARRSIRIAASQALLIALLEVWLVDLLALISPELWPAVRSSLVTAALTVTVGYVAWELLHRWTESHLATVAPSGPPGEDEEEAAPASRLTTLLPLLRGVLAASILGVTVMVALAELGVNIGPLIAGASIFGLAISFGSQALVRDIVSGLFFMIDDAFRVGEYIDSGRLKGTVEKISLRSVRLRHQSGQIHTIPFGQLSSITNFSRDWATVKFNLKVAPSSDLDKVRKTVKQVGVAMMQDPELGKELIQPLKLQGVADIVDNGIICRCKFTVRPSKPSWVQREAMKRIHAAFRANGIEFASNAVTVQTIGTSPEDALGGAAAASRPTPVVVPRAG